MMNIISNGLSCRFPVGPSNHPNPNPNPNWNRLPAPAQDAVSLSSALQTPLQALQSMDSQPKGLDLPSMSPRDPTSMSPRLNLDAGRHDADSRPGQKAGKLCELLTRRTSFEQLASVPVSHNNGMDLYAKDLHAKDLYAKDLHGALDRSLSRSSLDILHQSPQPGPGHSPPEKPQSTSIDDVDSALKGLEPGGLEKKDNAILKKLLSLDDDSDSAAGNIMDTEISSSPHTSNLADSDKGGLEMDKNEAEAKKPANILLKVSELCFLLFPP